MIQSVYVMDSICDQSSGNLLPSHLHREDAAVSDSI